MSYGRVTPLVRQGTLGVSVEYDVESGNGIWINPPDRVAAITVAVHIPLNKTAQFTIETSCNRVETIGEEGLGGYWDNPFGEGVILKENTTIMIANAVTGIRVKNLNSSAAINVCFVG